jgi:catechol 2,3-dioxygenase-like lactoylglutathione lyase family enzyme
MAITCPRCGSEFDATLFQFGHRVRCPCGAEIEYPGPLQRAGHVLAQGDGQLIAHEDHCVRVNEMIQRIDHVNLVVSDMQRMVAFYRDVLGMRLTKQAVISGPWIEAATGLSPVEAEVAFLEAASGPGIELIRYRTPAGPRADDLGRPNAHGLRHVAFRVTDLDRLVAAMEAAGIKMVSAVQQVSAAQVDYAEQRKRLVYCHDPEGNLLELCDFQ